MSRIVWLSNATWSPSGYGEQTGLVVPRFQRLGHDMAIATNYGLQGAKFDMNGLTIYPSDGGWGNSTIGTFAAHHKADFVITLADAWVMRPDDWPDDLRMAIWAPIDHWPIPPAVLAVLQHPKVMPIAMSRFGEEWMRKFELEPCYVPHGVDTNFFGPVTPDERRAIKHQLEIPEDAFLIGMVAANKGNPTFPRKSFPQAFDAFAQFVRTHPDAYLYVHTDAMGGGKGSGINLDVLARAIGIPEKRICFPPVEAWQLGIGKEIVRSLYQAFDVLLNPSMGEGFGIPIIEAQACGVPVITSNHSAMPELTHAGWLVEGDRWWDALQESFAIVPSVGSIIQALEKAYAARNDEELRASAVEFALDYDADVVTVRDWEPALQRISEWAAKPREVPPLNGKVSRQVRRAQERKAAKA
jgi:glycosyltransferase involved in cell wall biosynthesis